MRLNYISELNSLVRSIILKSEHQSDAINNNIIKTYGVNYVGTDYTTWRYYLNLNGQYHFTNEEMEIYVIETNSIQPLTKELLEKYKKTREELSRCQITYKTLVKQYPNNELLIKGMINPISFDVAYKAKNGTVLSYSTYYVDINDVTVMKKLSAFTIGLYYRWFNKMYVEMDEGYIKVFLPFLYSNLYTKIDLIRMENIHTHKVHKHHMKYFFKSNLDIDTTYLNHKSKMWLYQNLKAVMTNNGQTETFKQLIDNVITPNEVGVGKVSIVKTKPKLENDLDVTKPNFTTDGINQILVDGINEHYYIDGMTLSEITSIEIANGYIHDTQYMDVNELVEKVRTKVTKNNEINLDTKVIHLLGKEDRDILPFPRINMVLDNLFHIGAKAITDFEVKYVDPNTNNSYTITMNQAIRLLGYYLLRFCNIESTTLEISSKSVFRDNDIDVKKLMIPDNSNYKYLTSLDSVRPMMLVEYFNSIDMVDYLSDGVDYFILEWLIKSSLVNQVSIANMDVINIHKCYDSYTLEINDIATEIGMSFPDGYDYLEAIKGMLEGLSNGRLVLDLNEVNTEAIRSYVDLLTKATSYNIQIIGSTTAGNSLHMFDVGIGELDAPIIVTTSGYTNGLEDLVGDMNVGLLPRVIGTRISGNDYLKLSSMTPMNGLATDESILIPLRYDLLDLTTDRGLMATILSDDDYLKMSSMTPMNGLATDESNLVRKIRLENIEAEGTVYGGGNTMKLELKKKPRE